MAFPPVIPPANRTNATPQLDQHPADHNAISGALTDIVTKVTAMDNAKPASGVWSIAGGSGFILASAQNFLSVNSGDLLPPRQSAYPLDVTIDGMIAYFPRDVQANVEHGICAGILWAGVIQGPPSAAWHPRGTGLPQYWHSIPCGVTYRAAGPIATAIHLQAWNLSTTTTPVHGNSWLRVSWASAVS